jgi:esterase/lipase superfamily enzyme
MTDDRLKLTAIEPLARQAYWTNLREVLDDLSSDTRDLLVFLHGYNVSFDEAALRAAQIGCDLQFPGVTSFFSWPSKGSPQPLAYAADGASMEASEGAIADFLCCCAEQTGANRVHVIAHSMGNRGLLRALTDIVTRASRMSGARFGHFILAAPDVERDNFIRLAAAYHQIAQRTTLYVSDKDRALRASGILHDAPRAGFTPPVTVVTDIDTVEVSNVDLTALGHGYVAAARDVLRDMYELLVFDAPPWRRAFLKRRVANDGAAYWLIGE